MSQTPVTTTTQTGWGFFRDTFGRAANTAIDLVTLDFLTDRGLSVAQQNGPLLNSAQPSQSTDTSIPNDGFSLPGGTALWAIGGVGVIALVLLLRD